MLSECSCSIQYHANRIFFSVKLCESIVDLKSACAFTQPKMIGDFLFIDLFIHSFFIYLFLL